MEQSKLRLRMFEEGAAEGGEPAEEAAVQEVRAEAPEVPQAKEIGKYSALEPVLDQLAEQLGVAVGDGEALAQALRKQEQNQAEAAARQGADRIYEGFLREAEQLKQLYPDFDLEKQLEDPRFAQLLRCRVDMRTAFEVVHHREILPAAMQYAARTVEQRLASSLRSGFDRPAENGIHGSGAVMLGSDAARMSRKDYAEICRMVERGERVSFG